MIRFFNSVRRGSTNSAYSRTTLTMKRNWTFWKIVNGQEVYYELTTKPPNTTLYSIWVAVRALQDAEEVFVQYDLNCAANQIKLSSMATATNKKLEKPINLITSKWNNFPKDIGSLLYEICAEPKKYLP